MTTTAEIKLIMRTSIADEHITSRAHTRNMNSTTISNRKDVIVREVVAASSRASALPKNLIAPLPYRITRGGVPEACCPFSRCTPEGGMEKTCLAAQ